MIDINTHDLPAYEPPAIVRVGAVVDVAAELARLGVNGGATAAYQPGDVIDWSNGRVS